MTNYFLLSKAGLTRATINFYCCISFLLISPALQAQVHSTTSKYGITTTTTTTTVNPKVLKAAMAPHAMNLKDFKKTDLYGKRQRIYLATFRNPSKSFSMPDGTALNISFVKNPGYASQGEEGNRVYTQLNNGLLSGHQVPINVASESNTGWTNGMPYHVVVSSHIINFRVTDDDSKQMSQHIFPGAIFTFDNFMNGSYMPPSGARNGIMLGTDHSTNKNFVPVADPTPANVQNAVQNMISHFTGSGNPQTRYIYYESNNMADWTMKVNSGGSGNGTNINTAFTNTDRTHHRFITIDVTKQLYSIYTNPPDNGFYSSNNSTEATPNLMVVGSVNYGVRLLVNLELTFTTNADAVHFKNLMSPDAYTNNLDINYLQSHASQITSISAYEVGGAHPGTVLINKNSLQSSINNVLSGVNNQNAKPVSFQLYDMAWDVIGATSATGAFNYVSNIPAVQAPQAPAAPQAPPPSSNPVLLSASVSINCGADGKNSDTHYYYSLLPSHGQAIASYSHTQGHSEWKNHTNYHVSNLSVIQNQGISVLENGNCNLRMVIAKPGTEPPNFLNSILSNPLTAVPLNMVKAMQALVGQFSKDDIHPFSLTLTLGFSKPGQSGIQNYNLTWNNLTISTKDNPMINLYFKYANGTFIKQ